MQILDLNKKNVNKVNFADRLNVGFKVGNLASMRKLTNVIPGTLYFCKDTCDLYMAVNESELIPISNNSPIPDLDTRPMESPTSLFDYEEHYIF